MSHYVSLLFLAALWGASFLFLRVASPEFGPVALIFVRTLVAALTLLPLLVWSASWSTLWAAKREFLIIGTLSTALPFSLFAYTALYVSAGLSSILNATVPFFSAIFAYFMLQERLTTMAFSGLVLGFVGVVVLSFQRGELSAAGGVLPILAALVATSLYAISSIFVKQKMQHLSAIQVATGSQGISALVLAPFAWWWWPSDNPSTVAWWSAIGLAVLSTALALVIFFRMLQREGVTRTVAVTYLIPLFGVGWGALFLGESIELTMLIGGACVLLGVALTSGLFTRR